MLSGSKNIELVGKDTMVLTVCVVGRIPGQKNQFIEYISLNFIG